MQSLGAVVHTHARFSFSLSLSLGRPTHTHTLWVSACYADTGANNLLFLYTSNIDFSYTPARVWHTVCVGFEIFNVVRPHNILFIDGV